MVVILWYHRPHQEGAMRRRQAILLAAGALAACGARARVVTVDGTDATGALVDPINVWSRYAPRGRVVGQVRHGERVTLLRQEGAGALIRTAQGLEGWIGAAFVRELRP
jgi:hypothetical protein